MTSLFCCGSIRPYRPQRLLHEDRFKAFMAWAEYPRDVPASSTDETEDTDKNRLTGASPPHVIQLVRQINYGPLESKRYFVPVEGKDNEFVELVEDDLIQANFKKLNSYKNFKCESHNRFFEVNVYEKDPVNQHHWRVNIARPSSSIDL
ncbi:hypothetical protein B0T14DRAFT_519723 [Immersiella caudata]|uniref:Uncharacterized protein n=1 Tax=Immersiella caudata TaxID=314043 RepID=A0AA40BZN6_9PEZI|nr:hypothetical protein B0T14DRAFT_519723 [Immersiella caudata]